MENIDKSKYKILVVDDVLPNVLLVDAILKSEGYKTLTASNGKDALELISKEVPDLILLDIMMPGMNGYEVASILNSNPITKEIPIIFLSALSETEDVVKGFESGANDYIDKPFKPTILKIRVLNQIRIVYNRRQLEEHKQKLERTIADRDKMYSVLAHDLRSPIASIKMILNVIATEDKREAMNNDVFYMVKLANEVTEETFLLLDNLLKWIKSQAKGLTIVPRDINLIGDIKGVIDILEPIVSLKNIKLNFDSDRELHVFADTEIVQTILRNLISNAVKYSLSGSEVSVLVKEENDKIIVCVKDYGIGIPLEEQPKLLDDSHSNASRTGTNNESGMGIGLKLCKELSLMNKGELWFTSIPNEGSEFYFSLPKTN